MMLMYPGATGGYATQGIYRPPVSAPGAPAPAPARPITVTGGYSGPTVIKPYQPPTAIISPARPLGPAPSVPTPPAPASPISGAPIQTSIFQPTHTTATILQQAQNPVGDNYQEPSASFPLAGFQVGSTPAVVSPQAGGGVPVSPSPSGSFLGLDQNTLILILIGIAVLIMVAMA